MLGIPFARRELRLAIALFALCAVINQTPASALHQETGREVPEVYLNHFYIVLDAETYKAIGESEFITQEFGGFEQRTTTAGGGESWTGTYIYGRRTYIELFESGGNALYSEGACGIAYGVEQTGGVDIVTGLLRRDLEGASVLKQTRLFRKGEEDIPWFLYAQIFHQSEQPPMLWTWVMEYHPGFLHAIAPETYPEPGAITREEYLKRFFKPDRYLDDIVGIGIELEPKRAAGLVRELEIMGWEIEELEGKTVCSGPGAVIEVTPSEEPRGIREIRFALLRAKEGEKLIPLGPASELEFGDGPEAIWRFK